MLKRKSSKSSIFKLFIYVYKYAALTDATAHFQCQYLLTMLLMSTQDTYNLTTKTQKYKLTIKHRQNNTDTD